MYARGFYSLGAPNGRFLWPPDLLNHQAVSGASSAQKPSADWDPARALCIFVVFQFLGGHVFYVVLQ